MVCMLMTGCGGPESTSTQNTAVAEKTEETAENEAVETEQTAEAETPAAEEQTAGTQAVEEPATTAEAEETVATETSAPEAEAETENNPEDNTKTLEVVDEKESELEDGTKCTETTYSDGSVKLIQEKDGIKTETNYDTNLYPQSKVVYDEEGNKKSETTFKYDENEPEKSWESSIEYDENGNVLYTSETENVYPQEEGYKYGAGPASGPDKLYPNPTGEGLKYGTELLPSTSETIVKDAQGGFVIKTISIDNEERKATVKYPDKSWEHHYALTVIKRDGTRDEAMGIDYFAPYDEPDKMVTLFKDGRTRITSYENGSRVTHEYDKDGNQIK